MGHITAMGRFSGARTWLARMQKEYHGSHKHYCNIGHNTEVTDFDVAYCTSNTPNVCFILKFSFCLPRGSVAWCLLVCLLQLDKGRLSFRTAEQVQGENREQIQAKNRRRHERQGGEAPTSFCAGCRREPRATRPARRLNYEHRTNVQKARSRTRKKSRKKHLASSRTAGRR